VDGAVNNPMSTSASHAPVDEAAAKPSGKGRVLIVEDNPINQRVAAILVSKLGFTTDLAGHGGEAVEMVQKQNYDLILMDCQMPVMDGFEATRAIRKMTGSNSRTPIIAVTANVASGQREKCLEAGMNDYVPKPINREVLEKVIDKWSSQSAPPPTSEPAHSLAS
jgi:CheY-like chemotaxis protein